MPTDKPLLLFGPMGAGKSTLLPRVAERLGRPAIDLDRAIEERAGKSVAELFASSGEPRFRQLEREELERILQRNDAPVVALGGGALVNPALRREAHARAKVVVLTASVDELEARLSAAKDRPLLLQGEEGLRARLQSLLEARREAYADAAAVIDTSGRSLEEVAVEVLLHAHADQIALRTQDADSSAKTSWVHFSHAPWATLASVVRSLAPSRVVVITDQNVSELYGEAARGALGPVAHWIDLPPGEHTKTMGIAERLVAAFTEFGLDRRSLVVTLGGGVVSDLGGFAAALYARGIRWVAVPTTVLAMVDAAIGGKTGVDVGLAKNAAGAFHLPEATIVSPSFSVSESPRARRSGLAEAIKSVAIGDREALLEVERREPGWALSEDGIRYLVERGAKVKVGVVGRDFRERGERALLNFGHTFGHAIESAGGFDTWTHGESVAIGMVTELAVAVALGLTPPSLLERMTKILERLGLPTEVSREELERALPFVRFDKKKVQVGGALTILFPVFTDWQRCRIDSISTDLLMSAARRIGR